jgi:type IV pilus assembly protein PilC
MAEFVCKLGTASGQTVTHTEDAPSEQEARQRLGAQGYYVFSVKPRKRLARLHLQALKPRSLPADDFMIFNQQFLTLSKSGLPLQKSLELLARQSRSPVVRTSLDTVRDRVRAGDLLSDAFDSVGVFPKIFCASLRAGERSGSLDKVLAQYLTYQKATRTFRKKFISALIYPAFLMCFLIGLVSFVVTFIVPRFAQLYTELDVALPTPTMLIISFSMAARKLAAVVPVVIVGGIVGLRLLWSSPRTRLAWDYLKFRLPVAGKLLQKFSVAEFARTLATLLQGGIPIVTALETARGSVSSPLLARAIGQAATEVAGGRSLNESLRMSGFFPPIALDMVEVGETTGALAEMLEAAAEFFEEDVNIDLATLISLVDPLVIAAIAIVVAVVLLAFYAPLFSMAAQVH